MKWQTMVNQLLRDELLIDQHGRVIIQDESILKTINGAVSEVGIDVLMPDGGGCECNAMC